MFAVVCAVYNVGCGRKKDDLSVQNDITKGKNKDHTIMFVYSFLVGNCRLLDFAMGSTSPRLVPSFFRLCYKIHGLDFFSFRSYIHLIIQPIHQVFFSYKALNREYTLTHST